MRALYFLLADVMDKFEYLKYGLAAVLTFVGIKMVIVDFYKISYRCIAWSSSIYSDHFNSCITLEGKRSSDEAIVIE